MSNMFAIIEIGSNNTKTQIYKDDTLIYELQCSGGIIK